MYVHTVSWTLINPYKYNLFNENNVMENEYKMYIYFSLYHHKHVYIFAYIFPSSDDQLFRVIM